MIFRGVKCEKFFCFVCRPALRWFRAVSSFSDAVASANFDDFAIRHFSCKTFQNNESKKWRNMHGKLKVEAQTERLLMIIVAIKLGESSNFEFVRIFGNPKI